MKKIAILTSAFLLAGLTQGLPAVDITPSDSVYGYYYQMGELTVAPGSSINYNHATQVVGNITVDEFNTAFALPAKGEYQITFTINLHGETSAAFGVQLNNSTIIPGSTFTSDELINGNEVAHINGTFVASLEAGDSISVVNLSDGLFTLGEYISPPSHNGTLLIKKLSE